MPDLHADGLDTMRFPATGPGDGVALIPVVVQDRTSGEVLMVASTSREMVERTIESGEADVMSLPANSSTPSRPMVPLMERMVVVLPAPLAPSITTISPS